MRQWGLTSDKKWGLLNQMEAATNTEAHQSGSYVKYHHRIHVCSRTPGLSSRDGDLYVLTWFIHWYVANMTSCVRAAYLGHTHETRSCTTESCRATVIHIHHAIVSHRTTSRPQHLPLLPKLPIHALESVQEADEHQDAQAGIQAPRRRADACRTKVVSR